MIKDAATDFATGLQGFWRGVRWLFERPSMLMLLTIPWLFALAAFGIGIWAFWTMGDVWVTTLLMNWFSAWQDQWGWEAVYIILKGLIWFSVLLLCLIGSAVVVGVVASPVYEFISMRIEREILGEQQHKIPLGRLMRVLFGEFLKALLVLTLPILLLLIPGVNLFAGFVAAFLLGWDFYDYPLARRGWNFSERWHFVRSEFWTVLGFGVWLAIPGVQILLVPMAVAGGTILNIEALKRRGLATSQV